jgi:hypothetical protein
LREKGWGSSEFRCEASPGAGLIVKTRISLANDAENRQRTLVLRSGRAVELPPKRRAGLPIAVMTLGPEVLPGYYETYRIDCIPASAFL